MFKSIQKSGRIAAVAIGLIAALSPLATPPAALAGGRVPTPEFENSYSFKTSSSASYIVSSTNTEYGYLYDRDDDLNTKQISLINFNDGSASPVAIPEKSLGSAWYTGNDQLYWVDGNNVVIFSPNNRTQTAHPILSTKYAYRDAEISKDGKRAIIENGDDNDDDEYELKNIEVYDLKTDKLINTYQAGKDDSLVCWSSDISRLYIMQSNTKKGVVALRVFNCDTGSTELKTVNVKKDDRSNDIDYFDSNSNSSTVYLWNDATLIKADRDGNMDVLFNDDEHSPEEFNSSYSSEFLPIYVKHGSNDLFEEDDGYYYLNKKNADLGVFDLNSGEIISSIAFPFGGGYLTDISSDGSIMLGISSDDDKSSACLVNAHSGAKSEFGPYSPDLRFIIGDRNIVDIYNDENDSATLRVDVYKSNIPHSVPEDVLYFVQNHLPFAIGGGVAIVLIIGGVIVILCVRKKRSSAMNGSATAAPKSLRKQRRRQKRDQQNAVTPSAPTMPATQAVTTEYARFCRHCGTPLVPEAQFCPTCGQKVD